MVKKILLQLSPFLYNKVKNYATDNEISVVGAIRLILTQFFKDKNSY